MSMNSDDITRSCRDEACGDEWEDEDSFGYGHECRLPRGHSGDHICAYQDDDRDDCRWRNWDDDTRGA